MAKEIAVTDEQLSQIADRLIGSTLNVYHVAKGITGHDVGEEIFAMLREKHKMFKCEQCCEWMYLEHRDPSLGDGTDIDYCTSCMDDMNGQCDDPEDEEE
jgi:hypothetical protein